MAARAPTRRPGCSTRSVPCTCWRSLSAGQSCGQQQPNTVRDIERGAIEGRPKRGITAGEHDDLGIRVVTTCGVRVAIASSSSARASVYVTSSMRTPRMSTDSMQPTLNRPPRLLRGMSRVRQHGPSPRGDPFGGAPRRPSTMASHWFVCVSSAIGFLGMSRVRQHVLPYGGPCSRTSASRADFRPASLQETNILVLRRLELPAKTVSHRKLVTIAAEWRRC